MEATRCDLTEATRDGPHGAPTRPSRFYGRKATYLLQIEDRKDRRDRQPPLEQLDNAKEVARGSRQCKSTSVCTSLQLRLPALRLDTDANRSTPTRSCNHIAIS